MAKTIRKSRLLRRYVITGRINRAGIQINSDLPCIPSERPPHAELRVDLGRVASLFNEVLSIRADLDELSEIRFIYSSGDFDENLKFARKFRVNFPNCYIYFVAGLETISDLSLFQSPERLRFIINWDHANALFAISIPATDKEIQFDITELLMDADEKLVKIAAKIMKEVKYSVDYFFHCNPNIDSKITFESDHKINSFTTQHNITIKEEILHLSVNDMIELRRKRSNFFNGKFFEDPAWDMLLHLFSSREAGVSVTVTALCRASGAATTTALRWIKQLETERLVERVDDPLDGRKIYVRLTAKATAAMTKYLTAAGEREPASS